MHMSSIFLSIALVASLSACVTPGTEITASIDKESVEPGTAVTRAGASVPLAKGKLKVNEALPALPLVNESWQTTTLKPDGKVKVISIVPSVDTRVCEQQTHILAESPLLDPRVERVTISRDLPAAQKRFAMEAELTNVMYLSDYRQGEFGKASGLLMEDSGLLARAVLVVDGQGRIRHLQVVPDVTHLPDMEAAFRVANTLLK